MSQHRRVNWKQTGISSHQRRSRIQKPQNQKIGMIEQRLMIQRTPSQRTGISQNMYQTQMPRSPMTGMMIWMVNGSHHRLTTQNTRESGNTQRSITQTTAQMRNYTSLRE